MRINNRLIIESEWKQGNGGSESTTVTHPGESSGKGKKGNAPILGQGARPSLIKAYRRAQLKQETVPGRRDMCILSPVTRAFQTRPKHPNTLVFQSVMALVPIAVNWTSLLVFFDHLG
jgi:hypothetical protein